MHSVQMRQVDHDGSSLVFLIALVTIKAISAVKIQPDNATIMFIVVSPIEVIYNKLNIHRINHNLLQINTRSGLPFQFDDCQVLLGSLHGICPQLVKVQTTFRMYFEVGKG